MKRASGILLPIFSLPSRYGVGDMGKEAFTFIDKLALAGQRYWQMLPLGPINEDNCPYQSVSCFAGETLFISPDKLREKGLLTDTELANYHTSFNAGREAKAARRLEEQRALIREKAQEALAAKTEAAALAAKTEAEALSAKTDEAAQVKEIEKGTLTEGTSTGSLSDETGQAALSAEAVKAVPADETGQAALSEETGQTALTDKAEQAVPAKEADHAALSEEAVKTVPADETGQAALTEKTRQEDDPEILASYARVDEAFDQDHYERIPGRIDYDLVRPLRSKLLKKAYARFKKGPDFEQFCRDNEYWLDDYALYAALCDHYGEDDWSTWEHDVKYRNPDALEEMRSMLRDELDFYKWAQFEFFSQWADLREYAHSKDVYIIGDIPHFAAFCSSDCWVFPELFSLDEDYRCAFLAGAPPDAFTSEGQCWGNPVYDWEKNKEQGYDWWIKRIGFQFNLFDIIRLDHMRGFESYFAVPAETKAPKEGHWEPGPGMDLFNVLKAHYPDHQFIAEDLGYLTEEVKALMKASGFPGMKIIQFAFDTGEENTYLPMNYETDNSVVYTGTHDNDTTLGWYEKAVDWKRRFATWYLKERGHLQREFPPEDELEPVEAVMGLVELAHSTRCQTSIIPMQDYLLLGSEARINLPGKAEDNWGWQMNKGDFTDYLCRVIRKMCAKYGRV